MKMPPTPAPTGRQAFPPLSEPEALLGRRPPGLEGEYWDYFLTNQESVS